MIGTLADFELTPALSLWLLVPGVLTALVLSLLLYREQRRMAPLGTVASLTAVRLLLIALIALLLLQPEFKWTQTRSQAGTLWILLDQSPSMQTSDPQSEEVERLRWADALGLISHDNKAAFLQARVHVLLDEMNGMTPEGSASPGTNEQLAINDFADRLAAWEREVHELLKDLEKETAQLDNQAPRAGSDALLYAARADDLARSNVSQVRSARTVPAASEALRSNEIVQLLAQAERLLATAADAADVEYLRTNGRDTALTSASEKVAKMPRNELAFGMLAGDGAKATKVMQELAKQYRVRIASFSDKLQTTGTVDAHELSEAIRTSLMPAGQATNIAGSLQGVAEQISPDEAASVVVITDGRTNVAGDPTGTARNLAARGVRVYSLLVGSHEVSPDAAVEPVDFPDWIYKGDSIRPRAVIRLDGLAGKQAVVQLRRGSGSASQVIDTRMVQVKGNHETRPFDFVDTPPEDEKAIEYEIRVQEMPGEVNTQNNIATFRVAVKKEKLYALMIEDRPRWEFRYMAAFLSRHQGMGLQTVMLQPATIAGVAGPVPEMASPGNPREDAQLLPQTLADWQKFDVIVVGDVGPDTLTPQMQQFLAATIRDKGATLITLAGQKSMPGKFVGTSFADLLPVTLNPQWTQDQLDRHMRTGFRPYSSPLASGSSLALLDADAGSNSRIWSSMPMWYWHSTYTEIKPAATAVWSLTDPRGADATIADANRHALLSTMTIGIGHSLYLAADQSWRLRQVGGANLHDRFWGQVLNWAVGSDLPAGGKYVRFGASQPVYDQSQPVVITARVLRDDLTPNTGLSFSAVARPVRPGGTATQPGPPPSSNTVEARFEPMQSPGYYQATLSGLPHGDVEISLRGAEVERLLNSDPTVTLKSLLIKIVPTMNAERRNMNTDPVMLEAVARAGGGFSLDSQYASLLFSHLPKIEHTERTEMQMGFFADPKGKWTHISHWTFLGLFAMLITAEWLLRKRAGLI